MTIYNDLLSDFKELYLGYSALAIIVSSCLGSIAVMFILTHGNSIGQMIELSFVVIGCMAYNTAVLSQQKPKLVFNSLILSVAISLIFIIINIL
tara:strand:+ start:532 stop:813 length:282 start_codon:yes stop_codon:yes gene_type:complete